MLLLGLNSGGQHRVSLSASRGPLTPGVSEFVQCFQLLILAVRFDKCRRLQYTKVFAVDIHSGLCNSLSSFLVDIKNMRISPGKRHNLAIMWCYITWHCSSCEVTQKTVFPQRG
jgi:hypothetical protein